MWVASLCVFTFALPALLLSVFAPLWSIALGFYAAGLCVQVFGVLWNTTVQTMVAPEALSRVSAYDHMGSIGLAPLGIAATGWLVEGMGAQETLWIAAAMILLPTAAVLAVPEVRSLRARTLASVAGDVDRSRAA